MKKNITKFVGGSLLVLGVFLVGNFAVAQEAEKSPLRITISYYCSGNQAQFLSITAKSKVEGKFQPVKGVDVKLFLDKDSSGKGQALIANVKTDEKGRAASVIPASLANQWKSAPSHTFLATTDKTKQFEETSAELAVAKARITIDTLADKNVTASITEFKNGAWTPVKGVEVKLAIKRLGGDLMIGDEQNYTTDSTGTVKGELKRLGMPGDAKGNIVLVAKVEDNDQYGNLRIEKTEPWGVPFVNNSEFFTRALWGSRFHSPLWLVVMAYSIVISVWGTLIYLVILLVKVKQLGKQEEMLK